MRGQLYVVSSTVLLAAVSATTCSWDSKKGATFDLSALQAITDGSPAVASDRIQLGNQDFLYTFGICNNAPAPANCLYPDGKARVGVGTSAPAWQTRESETWGNMPAGQEPDCKYLGNPSIAPQWSLLNEEDEAMEPLGVTMTYTGGQHCSNGQRRALALNFLCSKNQIEKIEEQVIDESDHCKYEITIESQYACPVECGFGSGGAMCNDHGICRYDTDAKTARCFCNGGWEGGGCDQESKANAHPYGPLLGLLIFVTFAIVVLIGGIIFLWRYMSNRALNNEISLTEAYGRLHNSMGADV